MSSPTKRKIIIAIDGFSSCGKSTFAKEIAARIGYVFIDTGAMYRAVTLYGIEHGAIHDGTVDASQLEALLPQIQISFSFNEQRGASDIYLNGVNVEERIRRIDVSEYVSRVSQIAAVRSRLVHMQQEMGEQKGVVMDGRDIGTVVFPNAELKIFMTADPHIRAERRYRELLGKGEKVSHGRDRTQHPRTRPCRSDTGDQSLGTGPRCRCTRQQPHDRSTTDGLGHGTNR